MNNEKEIENLEAYRLKIRKNALIAMGISSAVAFVGLFLFATPFFGWYSEDFEDYKTIFALSFAFIILGITFIFVFKSFFNSRFKRKINEKFKDYFLNMFFKEGYSYDYSKGLSFEVLNQSEILNRPDEYKTSNYFCSRNEGLTFVGADYDLIFYHYYTDKDGNRHRTENHNPGKFYVFTYPRKFNHYLLIMEKNNGGEAFRLPNKKSAIEFESMDFNKRFSVFCDDPAFAFFVITPQVQLNLMKFDDDISSRLIVILKENKLFLFMNNFTSKTKISLFKKLDQEQINKYAAELKLPLTLADDMDLEKEKFHNKDFEF